MLEHLDIHSLAENNEEFLRRLIEMMPLETLCRACQANHEINRFARFRVVDSLQVGIGNYSDEGYITYSELMRRPQKLTPMNHLSVYMHPGIKPKALIAKMEKRIYRTLYVYGSYHWLKVLCFFHKNLTTVKLFGNMEMETQLEGRFLFALIYYLKVKEFNLLTVGAPEWDNEALFTWNGSSGLFKKVYSRISDCYFRVTGVLDDGSKLRLRLKDYVDETDDDLNFERLEFDPEDSDDKVVEDLRSRDVRVKILKVKSANCRNIKYGGYINYSHFINRPYKTTPWKHFHVYMGTDIKPTVLIDKMEQKEYRNLFIHGDYSWRDVVDFLHSGLDLVKLYGRMKMEYDEDGKAFFTALAIFGARQCVLLTEDSYPRWTQRMASNTWGSVGGDIYSCFSGGYFRVTRVLWDGSKQRLKIKFFEDTTDDSSNFEYLSASSNYSVADNSVEAEPEDADDENMDTDGSHTDAETDVDLDDDQNEDVDDLPVHDELVELLDGAADPEAGMPDDPNDVESDFFADDEAEPDDSGEETSADSEPEIAAGEDEELKFSDNETLTLMMCLLIMILNEIK